MEGESTLRVVATVYRLPEAHVLVSMLRAYGIPAFPFNIDTVTVNGKWTLALGGIPICVPAQEWDLAAELLAGADFGGVREAPRAPYSPSRPVDIVLTILLWFLGVAPPLRMAGHPHGWRPRPREEAGGSAASAPSP